MPIVGSGCPRVNYATSLQAVDDLRPLVPPGVTMAQLALWWILEHPEVTTIPGAKSPAQLKENVRAAELPLLDAATRR